MSARRVVRQGPVRVALSLALLAPFYWMARLPTLDAAERAELAQRFAFERTRLEVPAVGPSRSSRPVHPQLEHVAGWINVLGASAALADLDGNGLCDDLCLGDPRRNRLFVMPVPTKGSARARYAAFALDPAPLAFDDATMAPMGARFADVDEDGALDIVAYYWGRPPIVFARRPDGAAAELGARAFEALELAADPTERWYTNAAVLADLDGDGHADLVCADYFPDGSHVLDAAADDEPTLHDSMSRAANGGAKHFFLGTGERARPFVAAEVALPEAAAHAWTLASGAADLDGDLLPELYFANDFGPDRLFHNRSKPGHVELAELHGVRHLATPRSKVLGGDSFKGMGLDFGDVNGDGRLDFAVSNITTQYGLMESQFVWVSGAPASEMQRGVAPYDDLGEELGLSRSGWGWDVRIVDCDDDGTPEVLHALGFLAGATNRWPELHEVAMAGDPLLASPAHWHRFSRGDRLSGDDHPAFFAAAKDGRYHELGADVGLGDVQVTRAIAVGDVDGDGDEDLVLANQWQDSFLYENTSPSRGTSLVLHLVLSARGTPEHATQHFEGRTPGLRVRPAFGAQARVMLGDGRVLVAQVDGGSGHSGARASEVHFGLGVPGVGAFGEGPSYEVELSWRDELGEPCHRLERVRPGVHTFVLGRKTLEPPGIVR